MERRGGGSHSTQQQALCVRSRHARWDEFGGLEVDLVTQPPLSSSLPASFICPRNTHSWCGPTPTVHTVCVKVVSAAHSVGNRVLPPPLVRAATPSRARRRSSLLRCSQWPWPADVTQNMSMSDPDGMLAGRSFATAARNRSSLSRETLRRSHNPSDTGGEVLPKPDRGLFLLHPLFPHAPPPVSPCLLAACVPFHETSRDWVRQTGLVDASATASATEAASPAAAAAAATRTSETIGEEAAVGQGQQWPQQQQEQGMEEDEDQFVRLPDDLFNRISKLLSLQDLAKLCTTSRDMRHRASCCLALPHRFHRRVLQQSYPARRRDAAITRVRFVGVGECCQDESFDGKCRGAEQEAGQLGGSERPVVHALEHELLFEEDALNPVCGHSGVGPVMARRVIEGLRAATKLECPVGLLCWASGSADPDLPGCSSGRSGGNMRGPTLASCSSSLTELCLTGRESDLKNVRRLAQDLEGAGELLPHLRSLSVKFPLIFGALSTLAAGVGEAGARGGALGEVERVELCSDLVRGLSQLEVLHLEYAPLRLMPGVTFPALRHLRELRLTDLANHLFDFDVLVGAPALTSFTLWAGVVKFGSPWLLSNLPPLKYLSVISSAMEGEGEGGWMRRCEVDAPVGLPSLTYLSFSSQGRMAFVGELSTAANLQYCELCCCEPGRGPVDDDDGLLHQTDAAGLQGLSRVVDLDVVSPSFSALSKLISLTLNWNRDVLERPGAAVGVNVRPLPTRFLPSGHLRSLQELTLSDNSGRWGLDGAFRLLTKLCLSLPNLSSLHPSWARYARELRSLSLTLREARSLEGGPSGLGGAWPRLEYISMSSRSLRTFSWEWFAQFGRSLRTLYLSLYEIRELPEVPDVTQESEEGPGTLVRMDRRGLGERGGAGAGPRGWDGLCATRRCAHCSSAFLPRLEELDLWGCMELLSVPASLARLRWLRCVKGPLGASVPEELRPIYNS